MSTSRFPVLCWEDTDGGWTAALVEDPWQAAFGDSLDDVLMQVKELVSWRMEHEPWDVMEPDFLSPELFTVKVPLQTEYRVDLDLPAGWTWPVPSWMSATAVGPPPSWRSREGREKRKERSYPSTGQILLPVVGVRGRQESGVTACSLPQHCITFYTPEPAAVRELAKHYVQEELSRLTPQEITRFFPPRRVVLEHVVARWPHARTTSVQPHLPDLTATCSAIGDPAFRRAFMRSCGRGAEQEALRKRLAGERSSVLLVGRTSAGKTSLLVDAVAHVEKLAAPARSGERDEEESTVPRHLRRFWMTSAGRLVAGMRYLGQWQERCERVIAQLESIDGVLCVERLVDLVRMGGREPNEGIAAFLAPYVARGELRMVAEATPEEVEACRRLLPGFAELFVVLGLEPFAAEQESGVLQAAADALARQRRVVVADGVAAATARLFRRFSPYAGFPGHAVAFLRDLAGDDGKGMPRPAGDLIAADEAVAAFSRRTGLPETLLRDECTLDEGAVREYFRAQVIGQEEACRIAARLVIKIKAGLHDTGRPLGVLLFCGPTGVGKTELAKALARWFFGSAQCAWEGGSRLVRLDMSEYGGYGAAQRLLGSPDGEPGLLIRRLREQPFSVVLLDEIEKADPEIFDVLLGALDEGTLRDAYGRVTTFRSAIVVMTSNIGADAMRQAGLLPHGEPSYAAEARRFFRPEFFNRLDAVVRFHALSPADVRRIARKELEGLAHRDGLISAGITLQWGEAVVEMLAGRGYDPRYGARPLQRAVDTLAAAPLARLLAARPELRDCTIRLDVEEGGDEAAVTLATSP